MCLGMERTIQGVHYDYPNAKHIKISYRTNLLHEESTARDWCEVLVRVDE